MNLTGIKIVFEEGGARLDFTTPVSGFDTTVQCVLVNIGTNTDTDAIYPDRGTKLLIAGLVGKLFSRNQAVHESNFAAARAKTFLEETTPAEITERIRRVRIDPIVLTRERMETNVVIETTSGKLVGTELSV